MLDDIQRILRAYPGIEPVQESPNAWKLTDLREVSLEGPRKAVGNFWLFAGIDGTEVNNHLRRRLAPNPIAAVPLEPFDFSMAWMTVCHPDCLPQLTELLQLAWVSPHAAFRQVYVPVPLAAMPELQKFWESSEELRWMPPSFNFLFVPYVQPEHISFLIADILHATLGPMVQSPIGYDYYQVMDCLPAGVGMVTALPIPSCSALPLQWQQVAGLEVVPPFTSALSTLLADESFTFDAYQLACSYVAKCFRAYGKGPYLTGLGFSPKVDKTVCYLVVKLNRLFPSIDQFHEL